MNTFSLSGDFSQENCLCDYCSCFSCRVRDLLATGHIHQKFSCLDFLSLENRACFYSMASDGGGVLNLVDDFYSFSCTMMGDGNFSPP